VLLVSVGGYALLTYFDGRIGRIHLWFGADRPSAVAGVQNWLLVGTDSRAGTGGEYSRGGPNQEDNSDTQILAHLSPDGTTTLVSFPRDTYVPIPAYTDSHGVTHPAHNGKMNSALPTGGPSLLVHTLETVTGLRIDHYASVDLAGFKTMTDALGGVDVCVRASRYVETGVDDTGRPYRATNLDDPFSQFHAAPGTVHLDGEQALAFVRQRHGFPDGDLSRIRRQQTFLGAVVRTATSSRILSDPVTVTRLLNAATGVLTVDDQTSVNDLEALAGRLRGLAPAKVRFQTIPTHTPSPGEQGADSRGFIHGMSVLAYDPAQLAAFLRPLVDDGRAAPTSQTPPPATAAVPAVPPGTVRVVVDNGSDVTGAAHRAARALAADGFRIAAVGNAATQPDTVVRYGPGQHAAADTLAGAVGGAATQADPALGATLVLVLGTDHRAVTATPAAAPAGPPPPAAPAPAPPPAGPAPMTATDLNNRCTY
jgi:LCP family protein required for cell wall assembly